MKKEIFPKLWILIILLFQISCTKEENPVIIKQEPPVTLPDMTACHRTDSWDSLAIHNKLLNKWEWEYIKCYWDEDGNYTDFKGMLVEFKADNTLEVKVNGQTTQTSVWKIVSLNDGNFSINVSPIVLQLPGRILFCNERVLFSDSYTDGCDNYFKKEG